MTDRPTPGWRPPISASGQKFDQAQSIPHLRSAIRIQNSRKRVRAAAARHARIKQQKVVAARSREHHGTVAISRFTALDARRRQRRDEEAQAERIVIGDEDARHGRA